MKAKILTVLLFAAIAFGVNAQSDYSTYLDKTMEKLEKGDCDGARKFYNVYKELSGKSVSSIEVMIADCVKDITYRVGDSITVGKDKYLVAYIRDGGKHGLAVLNKGWSSLRGEIFTWVQRKNIPTVAEMKQIYGNRDLSRLYDVYWTCSRSRKDNDFYWYVVDFSTGVTEERYYGDSNGGVILLIYRF